MVIGDQDNYGDQPFLFHVIVMLKNFGCVVLLILHSWLQPHDLSAKCPRCDQSYVKQTYHFILQPHDTITLRTLKTP